MNGDVSRRLKIGARVCWRADRSDGGTVTELDWAGVTIKWDTRSRQAIMHNDMLDVSKEPTLPMLGMPMPGFHFDLVDARTASAENDDMMFFHNEAEARDFARSIADRLFASEPHFLKGYCILVSDQVGEVYRAALAHSRPTKPHPANTDQPWQ